MLQRRGSSDTGVGGAPVHVHPSTVHRAKQVVPKANCPYRFASVRTVPRLTSLVRNPSTFSIDLPESSTSSTVCKTLWGAPPMTPASCQRRSVPTKPYQRSPFSHCPDCSGQYCSEVLRLCFGRNQCGRRLARSSRWGNHISLVNGDSIPSASPVVNKVAGCSDD